MRLPRFTLTAMIFVYLFGCPCMAGPLASIYISPGDMMLRPGMQQQFQVFGLDTDGNMVTAPGPLTWSTDSRAGTITSAGLFTAGSQTGMYPTGITVSAPGGFTAVCVIEVFDFAATGSYAPALAWGGAGAGHLCYPVGLAVSSTGRVYASDLRNGRMQAFDTAGNYVTMWGAEGSGSIQHPTWSLMGVTTDPQGNVYVTDNTSYRVLEFAPDGTFIRTIGAGYGSGNGQFWSVRDVAVDSGGNIYAIDFQSTMNKFAPDGTFIKKWSASVTGDAKSAYIYAIAAGPDGRIYATDGYNHSVKIYDASGTYITQWAGGKFNGPSGIDVDSSGKVYVSDNGNNCRIQVLDSSGNLLTSWSVAQAGHWGTSPNHLTVDSSGNVYMVDSPNNWVHKYTPAGLLVKRWGTQDKQVGQLHAPYRAAADTNGCLYVYERDSFSIRRLSPERIYLGQWGGYGTGAGNFQMVTSLNIGPDNCLYALDRNIKTVQKFDLYGNYLNEWYCGSTYAGLVDMGIDGAGNIYTCDGFGGIIKKYDSQAGLLKSIQYTANTPSANQNITAMTVDTRGYLYIGDHLDGWTRKCDQTGAKLMQFGQYGSGTGQLHQTYSMALDSQGNIFVADSSKVSVFSPSGIWNCDLGISGRVPGGSYDVEDIALDPSANAFAIDTTLNRVTKYIPRLSGTAVGKVKNLADGQFVSVTSQAITAGSSELGDCFYIQPPTNGVNGIKVTGKPGTRGDSASVDGVMSTVDGERVIQASYVSQSTGGSATAIGMRIKDLGGRSLGLQNGLKAYKIDGSGYISEPMTGMNNVGLLAKVWGRIKSVDTASRTFMFNDGGFYNVKCKVPSSVAMPTVSTNIYAVTGVISTEKTDSGDLMPLLRLRISSDLQKLWP